MEGRRGRWDLVCTACWVPSQQPFLSPANPPRSQGQENTAPPGIFLSLCRPMLHPQPGWATRASRNTASTREKLHPHSVPGRSSKSRLSLPAGKAQSQNKKESLPDTLFSPVWKTSRTPGTASSCPQCPGAYLASPVSLSSTSTQPPLPPHLPPNPGLHSLR